MGTVETHPAPPRAGLIAADQPVPLLGVTVDAEVNDLASRVVVTQRYRNLETRPIEAVYVFPLEEGAAVCGFEAIVDGVHVVGEVKERDAAFAAYDDALAAGNGAYLLDQERPDVFTASVGNLPVGGEVSVRITYVAELTVEGDALHFRLPTTVSPRYAPAQDRQGVGQPPSEALNPPLGWQVPYGLQLTVRLEMASAIRSVESPSHPLHVELDATRATVTLGAREVALDRDFVLSVATAEPHAPRARLEMDAEGRRAVLVAFQPRFDAEAAPCEMVFVVDRSGSMNGTSIAEARNALQLCLRSITTGTLFNVVGFGSSFESLFPESRPYDEKSLDEASRHVAQLQANLGGTEILASLEAVLEKPTRAELPRQVFLLTDGQVTNTEAVIRLVRKHSERTRVFCFGIGAAASHHLVRGVARAGGGAAEFIAPGERIEKKVLRQLERALRPALTDVRVDWDGLDVQQAPHRIPAAFAGGRVLVYGLLGSCKASRVTLSVHGPSGPLSMTVAIDPEAARQGRTIATLAARTLIRDLEEGSSPLHDRRGSLQERQRPDRVKEEIVRLGTTFGLCSSFTSFVAVEKRERPTEGEAQLRRIPVALTSGWGGLDRGMPMAGSAMKMAAPAAAVPARGRSFGRALLASVASSVMSSLASDGARPLDSLVSLQRADGSWDLTPELAQVIGRSLQELEAKLTPGADREARRALATALALRWLETHAGDAEAEWALLAKKARKWLEDCPAQPPGGGTWTAWAAS
jgi:Ca-activated chloride channel family protein